MDGVQTSTQGTAPKRRRYRRNRRDHGSGSVRLKSGGFHLQYYGPDGRLKSVKLCNKDDVHHSPTCQPVRDLAAKRLAEVAPKDSNGTKPVMTVASFWDTVYIPWAEEINPKVGESNLRASTLSGYKQIWNQHLKSHFIEKTLREYTTAEATGLLTSLAKTQGRNTLNHIRSLASGIFSHAIAIGHLTNPNPWAGAFALAKTAAPAKTRHYTLKEVMAILSALDEYPECRLVMALSFFGGLRPGEIRGMRVEDFTPEASDKCPVCQEEGWDISVAHFHVRRNIDKAGNATGLKTPESEGPLPLMVPIALALREWLTVCGNPASGWLFQTKNGTPADLRDWIRFKIRPVLKANKLPWKTLYAGRRGAATLLLQLSGSSLASQQLLRDYASSRNPS